MFQQNPDFKKKLLIIIAVALGLLGALLFRMDYAGKEAKLQKEMERVKQQEAAEKAAREREKVSVLVAARNIAPGVSITTDDVAIRDFPKDYVQPGAIGSNVNIVGVVANVQILQGEQILRGRLGPAQEKPKLLSEITPRGKRAVPVVVDNIASLTGLLQPGDYVDALAIISPPPGSYLYALTNNNASSSPDKKNEAKIVTLPLFQNVLVLAMGSETGSSGKEQSKVKGASNTVTLSLNPQESALASFIQEQGKIRLIMRSNADVSQTQVDPVNWDNLFEYLYPKAREQGKLPATVEIYRGLQKEVIPLSEGKKR
jgi:pilus assembly protein CpaB